MIQPFPTSLLSQIMRGAPFQPATNYWRAIELTVLMEKGSPFCAQASAILDLGCGDGEIMRLIRASLPEKARLTGVDIDPMETALAAQSGVYAQVITSSADALDAPDASFDGIISNSVLEHVGPIDGVLKESARVLRPGGVFIATVPAPGFHACLKGAWKPGVSHEAYCRAVDERLVHLRYWSKEEWQNHLAAVGLTLVACDPYLTLAQTRRWEWLSRLTGGLLYTLCGGRQRPIHLQRRMGVRRAMQGPAPLARAAAWLLSLGARRFDPAEPQACWLVVARK